MLAMVRLALRRPYTMAVTAVLIMLTGFISLSRMIVDIFPAIDIPVVYVAWSYNGLSAEDMERRVVLISERAYSTTVNGIDHIESLSIPGQGILKIYFQPGTDIGGAIAQISAQSNAVLRIAPPGMQPPNIIQFNASNVPVVQVTLNSTSVPEQQISDYANNFLRVRLFTIPGLSIPAAFGGKNRQIIVEVDPDRASAKGLSQMDVVNALGTSNVIVPAGVARLGPKEYAIQLNSSPRLVDQFNNIPVGVRDGVMVTLSDIATVKDAFSQQSNIVRIDGQRAAFIPILKHTHASTLQVVDAVRGILPDIQETAPAGLNLDMAFDQSVFVRAAVKNVVEEAIASSVLVSLMILIFLGSWRNTLVVAASIPLSIFAGLAGLYLTGQTINLMTLGGMALAIGMLVDNATVVMENIHRNQSLGKPLTVAIMEGAGEVVQPLTVATLCICIVFIPVLLLEGAARFLFIPLAITVVLSMLASFILSFTVVPALARQLLSGEDHGHSGPKTLGARLAEAFDRHFDKFRDAFAKALTGVLGMRRTVLFGFGGLLVITFALAPNVGTDFYPTADVGILKLHVRAPAGNRLESTEAIVSDVEESLRKIIPPTELRTINAMIGVPGGLNLAFVPSDNTSGADAELLISLKSPHRPTDEWKKVIREKLAQEFPGVIFYFQTADIVSQVLNFGLSAPIDIQIQDQNFERSYAVGQQLLQKLKLIPGVVDPHITQVLNFPSLQIEVDRQRAVRLGVSQRDVANNMLASLSGSSSISPTYFLNPQNGVNYSVVVNTPIDRLETVQDILSFPAQPAPTSLIPTPQAVTPTTLPSAPVTRLGDIASVSPGSAMNAINHYTIQRVIDVAANVEGRDLGSTAAEIKKAIADVQKDLPSQTKIYLRGQNEVMEKSFKMLAFGLVLAIFLVYAVLVVLFQSWIDPFIIMMAVPGALIGIIWMLAASGTTINVVSLMGSIMTVGICVSNSILVVSFANDLRTRNPSLTPFQAVIESASTRLRPIMMTALAMIIGMIPMALGLGEAGEQNAPLGRAVIGGLSVATFATLFLVPIFYTLLRKDMPQLQKLDQKFNDEMMAEGVVDG